MAVHIVAFSKGLRPTWYLADKDVWLAALRIRPTPRRVDALASVRHPTQLAAQHVVGLCEVAGLENAPVRVNARRAVRVRQRAVQPPEVRPGRRGKARPVCAMAGGEQQALQTGAILS